MNLLVIQGRPTNEPELRKSEKGVIYTKLRVAVPRAFSKKEKHTDYLDVLCFDRLARTVADHLGKGALITVQGSVQQDSYINGDGFSVSKVYVKARQITIHDWMKKRRPLESLKEQFGDDIIPREITESLYKQIDFNDEDLPDEPIQTEDVINDLF